MAVETIRDLAFAVSLKMNIAGLKTANNQVTKFKNNVIKMTRSVNKNIGLVNKNINGIKTFKAVNRINKIGEAIDKIKNKSIPIGVAPTGGGSSKPDPAFKGKKGNAVYGTSPFGYQLNRLNAMVLTSTGLALAGINMLQLKGLKSKAQGLKTSKDILSNLNKQKSAYGSLRKNLKSVRDLLGQAKYQALGGAKGITNMAKASMSLFATMKMIRGMFRVGNKAIEEYKYRMEGLVREETFFANALKYREQTVEGMTKSGAKNFREFKKASAESLIDARKNVRAVAEEGVLSARSLHVAVGQMASFQIDTDAWFGGKNGERNIGLIADLAASVFGATASKDNMIRLANMLGKSSAMNLFGQLQRNGIVFTDLQKKTIRTGNETEKLSAIMEGLEQNVGGLNKEMSKSAIGAYYRQIHKTESAMGKLGETTIRIKTSFIKLYNAIFPMISGTIEMFAPMLAIVADSVSLLFNAVNSLNPVLLKLLGTFLALKIAMPLANVLFGKLGKTILGFFGISLNVTNSGMAKLFTSVNSGATKMFNPIKKVFGRMPLFMKTGFTKMLAPFRIFITAIQGILTFFGITVSTAFLPVTLIIIALGLVVQDLWTVFHGGEGYTKGLVTQFKNLWENLKPLREETSRLFEALGGMDTVKAIFEGIFVAFISPIIAIIKFLEYTIKLINVFVKGTMDILKLFGYGGKDYKVTQTKENINSTTIDFGNRPKPTQSSVSRLRGESRGSVYNVTQNIEGASIKGSYYDPELLKKDMGDAYAVSYNNSIDMAILLEGSVV